MEGYMSFQEIDLLKEEMNPFQKIGKEWFLITAGDKDGYNMMTASWGFLGIIWGKNTAISVVRPQRYTKQFIDKEEYFTMSFFGKEQREALAFCGSKSGRDFDKAKETGLTPVFLDETVTFEEAELVLVCKKVYVDEIKKQNFLTMMIPEANYPNQDYHTVYVGEIVKAYRKG